MFARAVDSVHRPRATRMDQSARSGSAESARAAAPLRVANCPLPQCAGTKESMVQLSEGFTEPPPPECQDYADPGAQSALMTAHSASLGIDSCQSVIPHDIEVHECTAARAEYESTGVLVQHVHLRSRYHSDHLRIEPHVPAHGRGWANRLHRITAECQAPTLGDAPAAATLCAVKA